MQAWKAISSQSRRLFPLSSVCRALSCKALVYEKLGQPEDVVQLHEDYPVPEMGLEDVVVEMMLTAINPSDINQIQGTYAIRPPLPAVGGGEGVGMVTQSGSNVSALEKGDWVIPAQPGLGIWRTCIVASADKFTKISKHIPKQLAATLSVNPTTAYRMIKDYVSLKPGDCLVQNGANSGVGQSVIQLAAAWGINTINIIRDRPNVEELMSHLKEIGATEVVTEKFSSSHRMSQLLEKYGKPSLGFNAVGGKSATNLMKHLNTSATMVTYGGMSKQPVTIGTGSLIFKDLRLVGHWNSKWIERNLHSAEHLQMLSELCDLAEQGKLRPPLCTEHLLENYTTALSQAMVPYIGSKQLLVLNN